MDTSQYLEIFIEETREHLQNLNEQILILEKEPENKDTINEIFRAAHSLKGMSGTMGFKRMQRLTHDMENLFQEISNETMKVQSGLIDILFRGLDALEGYLEKVVEAGNEGTEDNEDVLRGIKEVLEEGLGVKTPPEEPGAKPAAPLSGADAEKRKYRSFVFTDSEKMAIKKALDEKNHIYGITVHLQDTCLLKSARAFLVFKSIEDKGELLKSAPSVEDIEDEKFDFDFSWIFVTKEEDAEAIRANILKVSEIKEVFVEPIEIPDLTKIVLEEEKGPTAGVAAANMEGVKATGGPAPAKKNAKVMANRSVRVDIDKLDVLMNLVSELIIAKNGLVSISGAGEEAKGGGSGWGEQIEYLERVTTNLHESVMKVRMVPIESVVNRFPRMIRDLNKKLNKKMDLYMSGEETELDRTVIDEIGDPLMHLLRNAADHGLESAAERLAAGKPEEGSIFLDAYQDGNNVVIEIRDDGGGINLDKVRRKALEKGSITKEQAEKMSDKETVDLLFQPSFSTADAISDVSGRGVGLDVVKTKIESLGGSIETRTELGVGSAFIIRLPLTLAIIQALMVEVCKEKYAIPLGNIQTVEDIAHGDVKHVQTREVIHLRGSVIPLIRLEKVLDVPPMEEEPKSLTVVIVKKGDKQAGLVINHLIGQQEIVIKSIGQHIHNSKMIGGATILGDGEVALILEVNALV